jgi:hypothetical protein
MASLLMGTSLNMNMFPSAMADGKDRDDKRYHYDDDDKRYQYDDDYKNKGYEQSTYEPDPYANSYNMEYSYDSNSYDIASYDQKRYDNSYHKSSYGDYSDYKTKDKKYECRTGPFEGFFVSSVEFCDAKHIKKFDDRKDRDVKVGPQGPPGPPGANGTDGRDGTNGTDGRDGTNGTDFDPCVACLLDALVKLDSGAILVNVTAEIDFGAEDVNITLPLVIDVDVALLLQQQLAETLGLDANATIFEICAAINATELDIEAVIANLEIALTPIVEDQIAKIVLTIVAAINDLVGGTIIDWTAEEVIEAVDIQAIVDQITANVEVSLGILQACLAQESVPPVEPPVGCARCFESESVGGQLPPPRVIELDAYLANPANIVPIGNDPDVDNRDELCEAIDQADGGPNQVTEQDIRDLLDDALENPPPGQVQQVIDCLLDAGVITETP